MTTLADLTTPMTVDEARTAIYDAMAAKGVRTTSWKPGAVVRTIVTCVAIVLAAFSRFQATVASGGFLELAAGQWLTLVAYYVYGVERSAGAFASGIVRFDNSGGGVYTGAAGDLVVRNSTTNKTYRNTEAFSIGALALNVDIAFQATELGADSTSGATDIDQLVTTLPGVTCENPTALVGLDAETDAELRTRCSAKLGSLSPNGARDAYEYIARSTLAADGSAIGVTRVRTIPDGLGGLDVFLATATGTVTGTEGDPSTPLGAIAAAIQAQVEPLGITASVSSATAYVVAVTYELWVRTDGGMTDAQIQAAVSTALAEFFAGMPIGGDVITPPDGKIYQSAIAAVIGSVRPDTVRVSVTLPAADLLLLVANAPVLGVVTCTGIHVVGS